MPANRPPTIFSRRPRFCFLVRAALPLVPVAPGRLPAGRGGWAVPVRDAVVRARAPAGGRPDPRPPPPVLRVRAGGGRRTEPARGATGEVSSWDGTRNPFLTGLCRQVFVGEPGYRSPPLSWSSVCRKRCVFSCGSGGGPRPAIPGRGCCDGGFRRDDGPPRRLGLLRGGPAPALAGLLPRPGLGTQDVRGVEVVPSAAAAHLDGVHRELLLRRVHAGELGLGLGLPGGGAQVVAVDVVHESQAILAADRAGGRGRLAVVLRRPGQVRTGIADLEQTRAARVHVGEDGSPLQRVVHDGSTSGHGGQCTHRA